MNGHVLSTCAHMALLALNYTFCSSLSLMLVYIIPYSQHVFEKHETQKEGPLNLYQHPQPKA